LQRKKVEKFRKATSRESQNQQVQRPGDRNLVSLEKMMQPSKRKSIHYSLTYH